MSDNIVETGNSFPGSDSLETGPFQDKIVKKIYGGEKDGSKDQIKKNGTEEGSFL